jgi:hypothetical protein
MPAHCPSRGEGLKETRWRDLQLSTMVGMVKLRVRHGYSPALEQWTCRRGTRGGWLPISGSARS